MDDKLAEAKLLFSENNFDEVIKICNQILCKKNDSIESLKLIYLSLFSLNKFYQARSYLNKCLEIEPDNCDFIKDLRKSY